MSRLQTSAGLVFVAATLLAGCGGGLSGPISVATSPPVGASPTPTPLPPGMTAAPATATPTPLPSGMTAAPVTASPTPLPSGVTAAPATASPTPLPPGVTAAPATASPTPLPPGVTAPPATATPTPLPPGMTAPPATATPTPLPPGMTAAPATTAPATTAPATTAPATKAPATIAPATTAPVTSAPATPNVEYHPSNNGTVYDYAGSSVTSYQRPSQYPTPEPTQTTAVTITQTVAVTNPATFGGASNALDYVTTETDHETAPTVLDSSITYNSYYQYTNTSTLGNFQYLGFTSVDNSNDTVAVTYPAGGDLSDMLPEAMGQMWTNPATSTISATIPNGESSQETIDADGSYMTTINYQNVGGPSSTAVVASKVDGTGTYSTPRLGTSRASNYSFSVSAPSGGNITGTEVVPAAPASTATPEVIATTFPSWIPTGFVGTNLSTETDVDNGAKPVPAVCKLPATFGTTANQIVQVKKRVDPMLGQIETTTTTSYDSAGIGPACVTIDDVLTYYYDFTGQNGSTYFSGAIQQISELQETLGLTSETIMSSARSGGQRFASARTFGARVQVALAHVASARALERQRFLRSTVTGRHFDARTSHPEGFL